MIQRVGAVASIRIEAVGFLVIFSNGPDCQQWPTWERIAEQRIIQDLTMFTSPAINDLETTRPMVHSSSVMVKKRDGEARRTVPPKTNQRTGQLSEAELARAGVCTLDQHLVDPTDRLRSGRICIF